MVNEEKRIGKSRKTDKYKEKLPEALFFLFWFLMAWGFKAEIQKRMMHKEILDLRTTIEKQGEVMSIRWGLIRGNGTSISDLKNISDGHAREADEAVDGLKEKLCKNQRDITRLEGLHMKGLPSEQ